MVIEIFLYFFTVNSAHDVVLTKEKGSAIPNHHLEDNEPTMIRAYAFWRRRFYIIMELVVSLGWRGSVNVPWHLFGIVNHKVF